MNYCDNCEDYVSTELHEFGGDLEVCGPCLRKLTKIANPDDGSEFPDSRLSILYRIVQLQAPTKIEEELTDNYFIVNAGDRVLVVTDEGKRPDGFHQINLDVCKNDEDYEEVGFVQFGDMPPAAMAAMIIELAR